MSFMQTITAEKLREKLRRLVEVDALEAVRDPNRVNRYYIPYMMSDGVEDYLILDMDPARYTGEDADRLKEDLLVWSDICPADSLGGCQKIQGADEGAGTDLEAAIAQARESCSYYQYHRMGHYWVSGQEHLRRLVYQLGIIHEKMTYLGREAINEREAGLVELAEFGPLRHFSPVHENPVEWHVSSLGGTRAMQKLAADSRDERLGWLLSSFEKLPSKELREYLIAYLASDRGFAFCQELQSQIELASRPYASRHFSNRIETWAQKERRRIDISLREEGLVGRFPHYKSKDGERRIVITEEMPFAMGLLDDKDMAYRFYQQETILEEGHLKTKLRKLAEKR